MHTFPGGLRVLGQSGSRLDVTLDLTNETLELKTDNYHIGSWDLERVEVDDRFDGIVLRLDEESALFVPDDDDSFLIAARSAGLIPHEQPEAPPTPDEDTPKRRRKRQTGRHRRPPRD